MQNRPPSTSIRQLLALAYMVIAIPAITFVLFAARAIDYRIEEAQASFVDGDRFTVAITPRNTWFIAVGQTLREINAPFSLSPKVNLDSHQNIKVALSLSDVRTAVLYIWCLILLVGALVIWWLSIKLKRPLDELNSAIDSLARDDLDKAVLITGASNFQTMGSKLDKLRLRLRHSDAQKTQFLRHISHEIKTPLTSIKEGSTLLQEDMLGPINAEQREVANILVRSSLELQSAIENLLDYSAAIAASNIRRRDSTNLAELTRRAVEKHALQIKQKQLDVNLELQAITHEVDPSQILTVFENLVSNAIKHSPSGGQIDISLHALRPRKIEFLIKDQGPGINPAQKDAIFQAFFVGDQATNTTLKGTGLGLSIAKQYVEAHEGSIQALETRNGATFRVVLTQ
ncbi:sensor histidine kinase [Arenicella xantha]|uniref:histidine kinase n=1 Tax=Arenicella xantha TaxID=644221 RepID=A0A395JMG3_9GAMM|nr:HAMP domain-containing sensor histidine kinase [Arenicella xantha]RBP52647.1 signal transduction histidine kinase [Arenicella xantha]